jgi:hypothetical protein
MAAANVRKVERESTGGSRNMKHTPGPWVVYDHFITLSDERRTYICDMLNIYHSEQKSNAHLIAAAPDLLEACKELSSIPAVIQVLGKNHTSDCNCGLCKAHKAIKKAENDFEM